jgi:hypothetical protein
MARCLSGWRQWLPQNCPCADEGCFFGGEAQFVKLELGVSERKSHSGQLACDKLRLFLLLPEIILILLFSLRRNLHADLQNNF